MSQNKSQKSFLTKISRETITAIPSYEAIDPRIKAAYEKTSVSIGSKPLKQDLQRNYNKLSVIEVWNTDTIDASYILNSNYRDSCKIGILNMASETRCGGGFINGAPAQEESICRSTTLYPSLATNASNIYPIPDKGVLLSPDVYVFRHSMSQNYRFMQAEECFFVDVISVAAIRNPMLSGDGTAYLDRAEYELTSIKIRELLRTAYNSNCNILVLGALGCGAYHNPPEEVAKLFLTMLREKEFATAFQKVVFAIIDSPNLTYGRDVTSNFTIFSEMVKLL